MSVDAIKERRFEIAHLVNGGFNRRTSCSAGFQTCCIAASKPAARSYSQRSADLEICDTADLEVCATCSAIRDPQSEIATVSAFPKKALDCIRKSCYCDSARAGNPRAAHSDTHPSFILVSESNS